MLDGLRWHHVRWSALPIGNVNMHKIHDRPAIMGCVNWFSCIHSSDSHATGHGTAREHGCITECHVLSYTLLQVPGAEAALLQELSLRGLVCNAATQLVVTCELCRRPATSDCWLCGMHICSLCTRRQHFKVSRKS